MRPIKKNYTGRFSLAEREAIGHLSVSGRKSELVLSTDFEMKMEDLSQTIIGTSTDGHVISCLNCIPRNQTSTMRGDDRSFFSSTLFPHFIVVGSEPIDASANDVKRVSFTTNDLGILVGDRRAFGWLFPDAEALKEMIGDTREEVFDGAQVAYFNGKQILAELESSLGLITIFNATSGGMGNDKGVSIRNSVRISVEFPAPIRIESASDRIYVILRFLSVLSGTHQETQEFIASKEPDDDNSTSSTVYLCMARPRSDEDPSPTTRFGFPLDATDRTDEFCKVMSSWIDRDPERLLARVQHSNCIREGESYTINRIVAAANMFDLLPKAEFPEPPPLSADLMDAKLEARRIFLALPHSPQRNAMLQSISRLGSKTLTSKVKHRGSIISGSLERWLPDLDRVLTLAVKCRNHFVHGPSGDLDPDALYPSLPFLTDALEFTFSASELIECGWDAERWAKAHHSLAHPFSVFLSIYRERLAALRAAHLL